MQYKKLWQSNYIMNIISDAASESVTIESFTDKLYSGLRVLLKIDRLAFALFDKGLIKAEFAKSTANKVYLKPPFIQHYLKSSLRNIVKNQKPRIINDLETYYASNKNSLATELLLKEGMLSSYTFPLISGDRCEGFMFLNSKRKDAFSPESSESLEIIGKFLSMTFSKIVLTNKAILNTISGFTELSEKRDNETGLHMKRIALYSKAICEDLKIDYKKTKEIFEQSPLHDIGKVGILDNILLKPGKLTTEEFESMKKHPIIGYSVLNTIEIPHKYEGCDVFKTGEEIIRHHHEKWDGSGYPDRLKGEEIPIAARIVAIADVFDALTSKRPYKEPFSIEESFEIIKKSSGSHFDPEIVNAFFNAEDKIRCVSNDYKEISSFQEAAESHIKWYEIVTKTINGDKQQIDEVELSPTKCKAGVFFESLESDIKSKEGFGEIFLSHISVHKTADKLLNEMYDDPELLEKSMTEFKNASIALENKLKNFKI